MLCPKCSAEITEGFIDNAKCPIYGSRRGMRRIFFHFTRESKAVRFSLETAITCSAAV